MAQNKGTLVIDTIRPNDTQDPIATAYASEIKGGHHSYGTLAERNSIINARREWGMLVSVTNDGAANGTYQLVYGLADNNLTNNNNWQQFKSSLLSVSTNNDSDIVLTGDGSTNNPLGASLRSESRLMLNAKDTTQEFINLNSGNLVTLTEIPIAAMPIRVYRNNRRLLSTDWMIGWEPNIIKVLGEEFGAGAVESETLIVDFYYDRHTLPRS